MSQEQDFKKLQQRTYQSYHQDGLIDIIIGLAIIGYGLMLAFDSSIFIFMGWMPIIFYMPLKNRLTVPRIGYVKFTTSNTKIGIAAAIVLLVILLGIFIFLVAGPNNISPQLSAWLSQYYLLLLGGIAALCFAGAALLTRITRFYIYALLILFTFSAGTWLGIQPPIFVIATGALIEVVGVLLLVRFLRNYPIEAAHESQ
jgi:hypothetical protein